MGCVFGNRLRKENRLSMDRALRIAKEASRRQWIQAVINILLLLPTLFDMFSISPHMQADNSTFNSAGRDQYNSDGQLALQGAVQVTGHL